MGSGTRVSRVAAGAKGISSGSSVVWSTRRAVGRRQGSRVAYQAPSAVVETSSLVAGGGGGHAVAAGAGGRGRRARC